MSEIIVSATYIVPQGYRAEIIEVGGRPGEMVEGPGSTIIYNPKNTRIILRPIDTKDRNHPGTVVVEPSRQTTSLDNF